MAVPLVTRLRGTPVRLARHVEELDQFADGVVAVQRVAERQFTVDRVAVATSDAGLGQIALSLEFLDDLAGRPFGDVDGRGDVPRRAPGSAAIKELIESGKVTPVIDRTYPLREAPEAVRYLQEGRARGKVAITV